MRKSVRFGYLPLQVGCGRRSHTAVVSLVKTHVNCDALRFLAMNTNLDVEDSSFRVHRFCPLWIQQRYQSSRGCWWCKAMPYLLGLSWVTPAESGIGMCAAWNTGASGRLLWQISSTFTGSSRLSVLWTHDRRRDRQWIRPDEVTAREQHHPGVTHPADENWLLASLQGLPPECCPPPALVRGQGDWWCVLEMAQVCRENQSYSFDDWSEY